MQATPRRKRFPAAEKVQILKSYRQGNLTQREFCARSGICLSSLQRWLRLSESNKAGPSGFIEIPCGPSLSAGSLSYRVQLPGGIGLEMGRGFVAREVEELCRMLHRL